MSAAHDFMLQTTASGHSKKRYVFISGVLQAFRKEHCVEGHIKVYPKGLKKDCYYRMRDLDGVNTIERVKGSALMKGFTINAAKTRTAVLIFIEPVE